MQRLKSFRLSDDFRIELFVSEPQVLSPVEMVFDENGKIYVAEMLDYPEDPPSGKPARSRIRLLEDRDGDGHIDQASSSRITYWRSVVCSPGKAG